jgi:GNAT superfamily N-acetyltransferase
MKLKYLTSHLHHAAAIAANTQEKQMKANPVLDVSYSPEEADLAVIGQGMPASSPGRNGRTGFRQLCVLLRDGDGSLVGGMFGYIRRGWLDLRALWVAPEFRRQGFGSRVLRATEKEMATIGNPGNPPCLKTLLLGEQALPVLERELHLGIKFPELNKMLQAEQSHRRAVVTVLARIPGEKSTGLLYRSLFNPPDNVAIRLTTLAALKDRHLSDEMLVGLLNHRETLVVLAAIGKAAQTTATPEIRAALEPLTRENVLEGQFMSESPDPSLRLCAAMTLRVLKNPAAKAALWKALKDPYRRESNECCVVPGGSREVYPVRVVAADALIDLGEDPAQVRATLKQGVETSDIMKKTVAPTGK